MPTLNGRATMLMTRKSEMLGSCVASVLCVHILRVCTCEHARVCVCVCVRERETERSTVSR